jgi:hypothetical protein
MTEARDLINGVGHMFGPLVGTVRGHYFLGRRMSRNPSPLPDTLAALFSRSLSSYSLADQSLLATLTYQLAFGESPGNLSTASLGGFTVHYNSGEHNYGLAGFDAVGMTNGQGQYIVAVEGSTRFTDWLINFGGQVSPAILDLMEGTRWIQPVSAT